MDAIRAKKGGIELPELLALKGTKKWDTFIRRKDMEWVHQATHVIALVNGSSHGVGMEIQEALRKPQLGFNKTPILCLVHQDLLDSLSGMIKGICPEVDRDIDFQLEVYKNLDQAKQIVYKFLTRKIFD